MNRKGHLGMAVLGLGITQHFLAPMTLSPENIIGAFACSIAGGKIPDLDFYLKYCYAKAHQTKRYLYHRQFTHSILLISLLLLVSILWRAPEKFYLFYLSVGLISHIIADMLTGTVPIFVTGSHMGPFRIGIRNDKVKRLFVSFGEICYIPMIILGIFLVFISPNPINYKNNYLINQVMRLQF